MYRRGEQSAGIRKCLLLHRPRVRAYHAPDPYRPVFLQRSIAKTGALRGLDHVSRQGNRQFVFFVRALPGAALPEELALRPTPSQFGAVDSDRLAHGPLRGLMIPHLLCKLNYALLRALSSVG